MKNGKTLVELAQEIERQAASKKDYVADTSALEMVTGARTDDLAAPALKIAGNGTLAINDLAHRQIGEHVGVPAKYYDRMRAEAPDLLATNVNRWMHDKPAKRMVRTLDGRARAFLSDRYRPLENIDLAEAAIPALQRLGGVTIISTEITERRLYIKAVDQRVVEQVGTRRVVNGKLVTYDDVCPTICISNSEVGMGALSIEVGMFTHECRNMALFRESSLRKHHVGGRMDLTDQVQAMLSDQTKNLTDAATWAQVRDVVAGAFDPAAFKGRIQRLEEMVEDKIEGDPVKVVELTSRKLNFTEGEQKSVLRHLIEGSDLSRYGLFNAITRTAEDLADYDRATDFERAGGAVIELGRSEWRELAEAA